MSKFTVSDLSDPEHLKECSRRVIYCDPARRYLRHYTQCGGSVEDALSVASMTILRLGVVERLSVGTNIRRWSGYVCSEFIKEIRRSRVYDKCGRDSFDSGNSRNSRRMSAKTHSASTYLWSPSCGEDIFDEIPDPEHRAWLREYYTNHGQGDPYAHQDRERARRLRNKYRDRISRVVAA